MSRDGKSKRSRSRYHGFTKRALRAAPSIILVVVLTLLFSRFSVFHRLERPVADWQMKAFGSPRTSNVVVVDITDEDYETIFNGRSPLDYRKLAELVNDIAESGAVVIGVDIDTSDPQFRELTPPGADKAVWAREAGPVQRGDSKVEYRPLDVLGGQSIEANQDSGVPVLMVDSHDKVARTYTRMLETQAGFLPTFSWAVVERYRQLRPTATTAQLPACAPLGDGRPPKACMEPHVIQYAARRQGSHSFQVKASEVLRQCNPRCVASPPPLADKIVLLGGSYSDAERSKDTPIGTMSGVEVLANVIETELEGGGPRELGALGRFAIEAFEGFALVVLFHAFTLRTAMLSSIAFIPGVAWICSLVSGHSFVFFLPILLAVLCFEWFMHYRQRLLVRLAARH